MTTKSGELQVIPVDEKNMPLRYQVPSGTNPGIVYDLEFDADGGRCNCPAGVRGIVCKHQNAIIKYLAEKDKRAEGTRSGEYTTLPFQNKEGGNVADDKNKTKQIKLGYNFDEVTSAMQKEIRKGDEEAAVYWGLLLYNASPQYAWKRVLVTAAEDIGLAAPEAVSQVNSLAQGWKMAKEGSWYVSPHALTMSIVLLCRSPKSTEIEDLQSYTLELHKKKVKREMPLYAIDGHTAAGKAKKLPWSEWYQFRHNIALIPVNKYTKMLAELFPSWFEGVDGIEVKDETNGAATSTSGDLPFTTPEEGIAPARRKDGV